MKEMSSTMQDAETMYILVVYLINIVSSSLGIFKKKYKNYQLSYKFGSKFIFTLDDNVICQFYDIPLMS